MVEVARLAGEVARLQALNETLAARIAAASEVLGRLAERGGAERLAVRYRLALEQIALGADGDGVATLGIARNIAAHAADIWLPGMVRAVEVVA